MNKVQYNKQFKGFILLNISLYRIECHQTFWYVNLLCMFYELEEVFVLVEPLFQSVFRCENVLGLFLDLVSIGHFQYRGAIMANGETITPIQ
jgi:hypothetical protein